MDQTNHTSQLKPKKISNTLIIFVACVLGLGIGLLTINYWHTNSCGGNKTGNEMDEFIEAFNRRLLQSESLIHKNEILMNKIIHTLEANLFKLEKKESEELNRLSKDEAIRIALYLANNPAPPMPEFPLSEEFQDAEKLADVVDDVFSQRLDDKNDALIDAKEFEEEEKEAITDADATKICVEWKQKYEVVIGVSWGNLPYDLQQKWLEYSCDYHLQEEGNVGELNRR